MTATPMSFSSDYNDLSIDPERLRRGGWGPAPIKGILAAGQEAAPEWFVHRLIPREALMGWFGSSGSGKSVFLLDLLLTMAMERRGNWHGFDFELRGNQRILYLAVEGMVTANMVMRGLAKAHGWTKDELNDAPIDIVEFPYQMTRDRTVSTQMTHPATGEVRHQHEVLRDDIIKGNYRIVVVDTLNAVSAGFDENSAEMGAVVQGWEDLAADVQRHTGRAEGDDPWKPTIIHIHHSPKGSEGSAPSRTGQGTPPGYRGSTAIRAAWQHAVSMVRQDMPDRDITWLYFDKARAVPHRYWLCGLDLAWDQEYGLMDNFGNPVSIHYVDNVYDPKDPPNADVTELETQEARLRYARMLYTMDPGISAEALKNAIKENVPGGCGWDTAKKLLEQVKAEEST